MTPHLPRLSRLPALLTASLISLAVAVPVLLAPVPSASADEARRSDPRDDVYRQLHPDSPRPVEYRRVGTRVNSDVVDVRVAYQRHQLLVVHTFADLERGRSEIAFEHRISRTQGSDRIATVVVRRDGPPVEYLSNARFLTDVPCPGMDTSVDQGAGTIRLQVPRSCLRRPDWVQVDVDHDYTATAGRIYVDGDGRRPRGMFRTDRLFAG